MDDRQRTWRRRQGRFLELIGMIISMVATFIAVAGLSVDFLATFRIAVPLLVLGIASFVMGYR